MSKIGTPITFIGLPRILLHRPIMTIISNHRTSKKLANQYNTDDLAINTSVITKVPRKLMLKKPSNSLSFN
jgi:hypothetical protein